MRKHEFAKWVSRARSAYPEVKLSRGTVEVLWDFLSPIEYADAAAALDRHIALAKWFPKPSEILAFVAEGTLGLTSPEVAYSTVLRYLRGELERAMLPASVLQAAGVVGWGYLEDGDDYGRRSAFVAAYRSIREEAIAYIVEDGRPARGPALSDGELKQHALLDGEA